MSKAIVKTLCIMWFKDEDGYLNNTARASAHYVSGAHKDFWSYDCGEDFSDVVINVLKSDKYEKTKTLDGAFAYGEWYRLKK